MTKVLFYDIFSCFLLDLGRITHVAVFSATQTSAPTRRQSSGGNKVKRQPDTKSGIVKFFKPEERYGFIVLDNNGGDVFFHAARYSPWLGDQPLSRTPQKGDRLVCKVEPGRNGKGPQACRWCFEDEEPVTISDSGESQMIPLSTIPWITEKQLRAGDFSLEVTFNSGGNNPVYWTGIIWRPATTQIFRIACWDGENSSYQPQLPKASLPPNIKIKDK